MAFKTVTQYTADKNKDFFILPNDNDFADVIFLYEKVDDVLIATVHYIKSSEYSGYAHCLDAGCPVCAKGIRTQDKLFIPLYNVAKNKIEFWDRSVKFENQLQTDVFATYPNPSEYVFRITRHGAAGSMDTRYEIRAIGRNSQYPYAKILADQGEVMPDCYSKACMELDAATLSRMLTAPVTPAPTQEYSYTPTPRAAAITEPVSVPVPQTFAEPPADLVPDSSDDDVDDVDF